MVGQMSLHETELKKKQKEELQMLHNTYVNHLTTCPIGHGLVVLVDVYQKSCRKALNDN